MNKAFDGQSIEAAIKAIKAINTILSVTEVHDDISDGSLNLRTEIDIVKDVLERGHEFNNSTAVTIDMLLARNSALEKEVVRLKQGIEQERKLQFKPEYVNSNKARRLIEQIIMLTNMDDEHHGTHRDRTAVMRVIHRYAEVLERIFNIAKWHDDSRTDIPF